MVKLLQSLALPLGYHAEIKFVLELKAPILASFFLVFV